MLEIQAKVTKNAAFAGAEVSTADVGPDYLIRVRVHALTADKKARLYLEDGGTGATKPLAVIPVVGPIPDADGQPYTVTISFRDLPGLARGAGRFVTLDLDQIDAAASIDYDAFIEAEGV